MEKLLSIIIPVFNGESTLLRCLESVYLQVEDINWFEVIVVDDGSTDHSSIIVNNCKKKYENLILVQQDNYGVSVARNTGLQKSKGQYVCFLDDDDAFISGGLKAFQMLDKASIDIFLFDSFIDTKKGLLKRYAFPSIHDEVVLSGVDMAKIYDKASVHGVMYRREFLFSNRILFAPGLANGEDLLFLAHTFIYAKHVVHLPIEFYKVHRTKNSESQKWCFHRLITNLQICVSFLKRIKEDDTLNDSQVSLIYFTAYRIFSFSVWFLIKTKKFSGFIKLRTIIKKSSFWPIPLSEVGNKKIKIALFNLSVTLFAFLVLIRNREQ